MATLFSLVGSYLDLTLAYLFLCASTLAFLTSKFLALFGVALPCSCNDFFGLLPRCLQGLLIDYPANKIAAVHMSLHSRFPLDFPCRPSDCLRYDFKFKTNGSGGGGQRTLCSLVGSYLDLALAYLFLCASTLAFLASKFLALFGVVLPRSCNGFFGLLPRCFQGLLINYPTNKIVAVHMSLRSRFPLDFPCRPSGCLRYDFKFMT